MFRCVLGRYVASTVLLVPRPFQWCGNKVSRLRVTILADLEEGAGTTNTIRDNTAVVCSTVRALQSKTKHSCYM